MNGYDELATGHQLHTIALLCLVLGIREQLEDKPMTKGEAGILIRRLKIARAEKRKNKVS